MQPPLGIVGAETDLGDGPSQCHGRGDRILNEALPELTQPPWYFRYAAARLRSGRRGGNFLLFYDFLRGFLVRFFLAAAASFL